MSTGEKSTCPFFVFSLLSFVRQRAASNASIAPRTSRSSFGCFSLRYFSPPLNEYVLIIFIVLEKVRDTDFESFCDLPNALYGGILFCPFNHSNVCSVNSCSL